MTPFERVQAARVALFGRVLALPEELRRVRPASGAWTPLELLEHMVREDRFLLGRPAVRKGRATRNPLFPAVVGYARKGWTIPATAPMLEPHGDWSLEEAAAASDAVHRDLALVVAAAGPDEIVAASALFGTLSADQLCEAIEAHYLYHLRRLTLPRPLAGANPERTPEIGNGVPELTVAT